MIIRIIVAIALLLLGIFAAPAIADEVIACKVDHAFWGHTLIRDADGQPLSMTNSESGIHLRYETFNLTVSPVGPPRPDNSLELVGQDDTGHPYRVYVTDSGKLTLIGDTGDLRALDFSIFATCTL